MKNIFKLLKENAQSDIYPFHMPGHKRNKAVTFLPADIDITEIDGFDNLHHATGILKSAKEKAAEFYNADKTWYLINGSTSGLLISISAVSRNLGGTVVMARNCHKAAYNAAYLNRLDIEYVYPKGGCIQPDDIQAALDRSLNSNKTVRGVVITSPTYDGIVSDIASIAAICHERDIPLIVDEAHGAHFVLGDMFPESALNNGADIVIHSLHKTLPSMTQTALLHLKGERVLSQYIDMYSGIYQSSSPSYVMMAGMDSCIDYLVDNGAVLCASYMQKLESFKNKATNLKFLKVCIDKEDFNKLMVDINEPCAFDKDCSKILIYCRNVKKRNSEEVCDGQWLHEVLLSKYHLQMEMAAADYVIALTSIMDSDEGFVRLADALADIDNELEFADDSKAHDCETDNYIINDCKVNDSETDNNKINGCNIDNNNVGNCAQLLSRPEAVCSIYGALSLESKAVLPQESVGCVSAEYIYLYPPGCPLIVPGERITAALIDDVMKYRERNYNVEGTRDLELKWIQVVIEETGLIEEK